MWRWIRESFSLTASDGLSRLGRNRMVRRYMKAMSLTDEQKAAVQVWFIEQRKKRSND